MADEPTAAPPDAEPPVRVGMMPENVAVLLIATLLVGLLVGTAIGQRRGLVIRSVELPAEAVAGDETLAATAPADPETLAEAREMVAQMGADADPAMMIELGNRKFGNGRFVLAAAFYEAALALRPEQPDVWVDLAACYHEMGRFADGLAACAKALQQAPEHPRAWFNQGVLNDAAGRGEPAAAAFRRYLELEPDGDLAEQARAALAKLAG